MIEYMKKEVFTLKSKNYLLRTDLADAKHNYSVLSDTHSSSLATLDSLYMQINTLQKENSRLKLTIGKYKHDLKEAKNKANISSLLHKAEKKKFAIELEKQAKSNSAYIANLQESHHLEVAHLNASKGKGTAIQRKQSKQKGSPKTKTGDRQETKKGGKKGWQRGSSLDKKDYFKPSKKAPDGMWDRGGFEQLLKEDNNKTTPKKDKKKSNTSSSTRRGSSSSKQNSRSNSRIVTPNSSRPQTPNSEIKKNLNMSSLAAAVSSKKLK